MLYMCNFGNGIMELWRIQALKSLLEQNDHLSEFTNERIGVFFLKFYSFINNFQTD